MVFRRETYHEYLAVAFIPEVNYSFFAAAAAVAAAAAAADAAVAVAAAAADAASATTHHPGPLCRGPLESSLLQVRPRKFDSRLLSWE